MRVPVSQVKPRVRFYVRQDGGGLYHVSERRKMMEFDIWYWHSRVACFSMSEVKAFIQSYA